MKFHILGLGSIGTLLSHHMRRAIPKEHTITLIHRTQRLARDALAAGGALHVENQGLVTSTDGFLSEIFEASEDDVTNKKLPDPQKTGGKIESLFITTKAHQTVPALRRLLPRLSAHTTIVLLQNGMGVYEALAHDLFRNPEQRPHFILASNTHGAFRKSTYTIVHAGIGNIKFGLAPDPRGRNFEEGFETLERKPRLSDITTTPADDPHFERYRSLRATVAALQLVEPLNVSWNTMADVQTEMRRKLVVNAVINPLTALMGCRNGDIFKTTAATRIMRRVCQEATNVFTAQYEAEGKAWLDSLASQGHNTANMSVERFPRSLSRTSLEEEVLRVAKITKGNISSMLADIRMGRPTEVEFMNGYLMKLGSTYRVPMPANATLLNLIKMRSDIPLDQML